MRLNKRPNFPLNKRYTSLAAAIATASVFGGLPQVSLGQESVSLIEEVVVTARKRQESLQDVPVAVTALTPSQLERGSIQRTTDIDKMVPNVELHQTYIGSGVTQVQRSAASAFDDIEKILRAHCRRCGRRGVHGIELGCRGSICTMSKVSRGITRPSRYSVWAKYYWWSHQRKAYNAPTGKWGAEARGNFWRPSHDRFEGGY